MPSKQVELFAAVSPEGFDYRPNFLSSCEESELIEHIKTIVFSEVRMHGVIAKRRVAHFGWVYGYDSWRLTPGPSAPDFLQPWQERAATLLKCAPEDIAEILITEYSPGAGIGWHRDAPMFGPAVVGISLLSACRFRFRRNISDGMETFTHTLEPRSVYVLQGPARSQWQHSIPATDALRYSVTFRTLAERAPATHTVNKVEKISRMVNIGERPLRGEEAI